MRVLALYDIHGNVDALDAVLADRTRMLEAGWPDERSVRAALIEPVEPLTVTRIFEEIAAG